MVVGLSVTDQRTNRWCRVVLTASPFLTVSSVSSQNNLTVSLRFSTCNLHTHVLENFEVTHRSPTHKPNHHQQVYFNSWSVVESVLKSNKGQENKTLNLHWILKTTYELVRAHLSLVFTSTTYWVEYVELRGTRGKTCLPTLVTFTFSTVEAVNASTVLWMILIVMIHKKHSMDDCMSYHQWYQSVLKSLEVPTL